MTRQGRHEHILIGGAGLVALAACFGFASPPPPAQAQPAGMTAAETQLVLSRLDSIERQVGWLWLAAVGSGAGGSAIGGMLGTRRRFPAPPTPTAPHAPHSATHRSPPS